MDSVLISSTKRIVPSMFAARLGQKWEVETTVDDGLAVHGPDSRVYLVTEIVPDVADAFHMVLNYSSVDLVKQVLDVIADDPDLIVDNDFGTVLPGDQFAARIRGNPHWNWRSDL